MLERPHFVIIGAMKCATSTLHDQLARQVGVYMSDPKEPNFFSDDDVWDNGLGWYRDLFANAPKDAICGESSTHYTKLPTHPDAAQRLHEHLPHAKLIYVMRDPVDRLVSQYIHAWSRHETDNDIDHEVRVKPEYIAYSSYWTQLAPWIERFGTERILPVFFERLTRYPQSEFERVCRFVGCKGTVHWDTAIEARNVSSQRLKYSPVMERALSVPLLKTLRRSLVPEIVRDRMKSPWRMRHRPRLSDATRSYCIERLDPELRRLGEKLGLSLECDRFGEIVSASTTAPSWVGGSV